MYLRLVDLNISYMDPMGYSSTTQQKHSESHLMILWSEFKNVDFQNRLQ